MASSPARFQLWARVPPEKKSCADHLLTFYKADGAPSFEAQIIVKTTVFASLEAEIITVKVVVFTSREGKAGPGKNGRPRSKSWLERPGSDTYEKLASLQGLG